MKACVLTLGCQLNEHKSEEIAGVLAQAGYALVDAPDEADVVLLNTCRSASARRTRSWDGSGSCNGCGGPVPA